MKLAIIYYFCLTKFLEKRLNTDEKLVRYHEKKFNQLKKKTLVHSPFYQPYLNKSLSEFPIINKTILMDNFNQINTAQIDIDQAMTLAKQAENTRDFSPTLLGKITVGLSSGTTGQRGLFLVSKLERAYWAGSLMAKLFDFPIKEKQKIALFLRVNSNLYSSLNHSNKIEFRYFDLTKDLHKQIQELNDFNPTLIAAPASVLAAMTELKHKLFITPRRVFSIAEVLDKADREKIKNFFQCNISEIYQATEGFLAITHRNFNKLLFNEDNLIIEKEWIDNERYVPIITDLRRHTLPIVRYRLDDIIVRDKHNHPFSSIKQIEGRDGDVCYAQVKDKDGKLRTAQIFADVIRHAIIRTNINFSDYRIQQLSLYKFSLSFTPELSKNDKNQIERSLNQLFSGNNYFPVHWHWQIWTSVDNSKKRRKIIGLSEGTHN